MRVRNCVSSHLWAKVSQPSTFSTPCIRKAACTYITWTPGESAELLSLESFLLPKPRAEGFFLSFFLSFFLILRNMTSFNKYYVRQTPYTLCSRLCFKRARVLLTFTIFTIMAVAPSHGDGITRSSWPKMVEVGFWGVSARYSRKRGEFFQKKLGISGKNSWHWKKWVKYGLR